MDDTFEEWQAKENAHREALKTWAICQESPQIGCCLTARKLYVEFIGNQASGESK